jgi:histidinol dehydrogenase
MKILNLKQLGFEETMNIVRGARSKDVDVKAVVGPNLDRVKSEGDSALFDLCEKFDGVKLEVLKVTKEEIDMAYEEIDRDLFESIKRAKKNIENFHFKSFVSKNVVVETVPGVKVWREFRPIEKVGLYVPGGKAAYFSTVLMLAIPAILAGCREVVMCTPCSKEGKVNSAVLVAADLCGVKKVFKVGGAQAIAAMAYGTESVPKVYKIFGPGNQYVSTAKMMVYGEVDIDMPAGPSEVLILADDTANPKWMAADLLSQLEHGEDSQAILVAFSAEFAKNVIDEMRLQMLSLSRVSLIERAFGKSFAIIVNDFEEAISVVNEYAPEHLEIVIRKTENILSEIINVGSVFLGQYSSEPLGDYASGANHTLPTSGFAKMFSPLSVDSFGKMIQVQKVSKNGIKNLRVDVEKMALAEGLDAHKNSITIRFYDK